VELGKVFDAYSVLSSKLISWSSKASEVFWCHWLGKRTGNVPGTYFVVDLINELKLPAVVVTRPALGTIKSYAVDRLASALMRESMSLGLIISFSTPAEGTIAETTNAQALKELWPCPVIGRHPLAEGYLPRSHRIRCERDVSISKPYTAFIKKSLWVRHLKGHIPLPTTLIYLGMIDIIVNYYRVT